MNIKKIRSILSEQLPEEALITDAEMGNYCSLRCGGRAALLVTAENMDELRYVLYVLKGAEVLFGAESCCGGVISVRVAWISFSSEARDSSASLFRLR